MRYLTPTLCALVVSLCPAWGHAELSDELENELNTRVETHRSEGDELANTASLLTLGILGGGEAEKALEEAQTQDDERVRLAAGLGATYADLEDAESFLIEQLNNRSPLYPVLRDRVALVPDEMERELLESFLEEAEAKDRKAVFRYLAQQYGTLYDLLGTYATHEDDDIRSQALTAVQSTARADAFDWAEELVQSDDEALESDGFELMQTLSEVPGRQTRAKSALKIALESGSTSIRLKAAGRLLELHDRSAAEPLTSMLEEVEEAKIQTKIVELMLQHSVAPSVETISKMRESVEDETLKQKLLNLAISAGDDDMLEKVREMYGSTKFDERIKAAEALGYANDDEVISTLGRALVSEGNAEMRLVAARGLRRMASEEALTPLEEALDQEKKKEIKLEIIRAFGSIGTEKAMQTLQFNSTVQDPELKKAIIRAVREANHEKGFEVLKLFFNARNLDLQWRAFVAGLSLEPDKAMKRADSVLRNPPEGFMSDLESLGLNAQEQIFGTLMTHDTPRVRTSAFRSARKLGDTMTSRFRELLVDSETPDDIRRLLVDHFAAWRQAPNTPYLGKVVRDASEELARRAAWALTRYIDQDLGATFRGYFEHDDKAIQAIATYGLASIHRGEGDDE